MPLWVKKQKLKEVRGLFSQEDSWLSSLDLVLQPEGQCAGAKWVLPVWERLQEGEGGFSFPCKHSSLHFPPRSQNQAYWKSSLQSTGNPAHSQPWPYPAKVALHLNTFTDLSGLGRVSWLLTPVPVLAEQPQR